MAQINNRKVLERIERDAFLHPSRDATPQILGNQVIPVLIANPERIVDVFKRGTSAVTGDTTIFATPTKKDFYLTGIVLSFVKDATCDISSGNISIALKINGEENSFSLTVLTLTAERDSISMSFPTPIKIDRSSNIVLRGNFTLGVLIKTGFVVGYTVETD